LLPMLRSMLQKTSPDGKANDDIALASAG
jgi:hypothetical protein